MSSSDTLSDTSKDSGGNTPSPALNEEEFQTIIERIQASDEFFLLSHRDPDGDAICSQMALKIGLEQLNKRVTLLSPGPFVRREIEAWHSVVSDQVPKTLPEGSELVLLDCSSPERIFPFYGLCETYPPLIIDHHFSGERILGTSYIQAKAPSCTLLVQKVLDSLNVTLTEEIAYYLFYGFTTDTGFFRFLDHNILPYWNYIQRWIEIGVTPNRISKATARKEPLASRILTGRILSRCQEYFDGKLIITFEFLNDKKELDLKEKDSGSIYRLLLNTEGVLAAVIIRETETKSCSIGLRSSSDLVDVSRVASALGGGGHRKASGAQSLKGREATAKDLINEFAKQLENLEVS